MFAILATVLPVFFIIAFGYAAVWRGILNDTHIEGLMKFTQSFAIPCLLFRAIATLDLEANIDATLLFSFYTGVAVCFFVGLIGARVLFGRPWEDAVAIAFCCLFSNSVLLGLPITERVYGADALQGNFTIIAFHAPFGYLLGITAMEIARAGGAPLSHVPRKVGKAIVSNALFIGIAAGFVVNLGNIPLPVVFTDAVDLMVRAALPAALFGLGGVLYRYRPEGDMRTIAFVCLISLGLHPAIVWLLGTSGGLSVDALRSAIVTASVAPGVNAYVFANMYGTAKRVAASSVLFGTAASILSATLWIANLP